MLMIFSMNDYKLKNFTSVQAIIKLSYDKQQTIESYISSIQLRRSIKFFATES
jgi:hypothetical protein